LIMSEIKPIRSEADYECALAELERLWGARSGTPNGDRLDVLATLIDAYESEHHPIDPPDPIEAIKFRMEQQGLTRRDLEGILGSRTRIAEVLNRRRGLSINMIRRLNEKLGISAEVLIKRSPRLGGACAGGFNFAEGQKMPKGNTDFDIIVNFMDARWPTYMHEIYQPAMLRVLFMRRQASVTEIAESIREVDVRNSGKDYTHIVRNVVGKVLERHGLVKRNGDQFRLIPASLTEDQRKELVLRCEAEIGAYHA
jgi:HTH-type transcriptional regulator / antitoxin HigA